MWVYSNFAQVSRSEFNCTQARFYLTPDWPIWGKKQISQSECKSGTILNEDKTLIHLLSRLDLRSIVCIFCTLNTLRGLLEVFTICPMPNETDSIDIVWGPEKGSGSRWWWWQWQWWWLCQCSCWWHQDDVRMMMTLMTLTKMMRMMMLTLTMMIQGVFFNWSYPKSSKCQIT